MSTEAPSAGTATPGQPAAEQPRGLPQGKRAEPEREARSGQELIDAAASDSSLNVAESEDLLAYYLENRELPGDTDTVDVEVELGHGAHKRKLTCAVRSISWAEWRDGQDRATKGDRLDTFLACSYHVARALVRPKLGPQVVREQEEAKDSEDGKVAGPGGSRVPPAEDAAALLRRMFRMQSGALLDLSAKVIQMSKLDPGSDAVREVEAAKN